MDTLGGCTQFNEAYGIQDGGSNWTNNVEAPIAGIDEAAVTFITLIAGPPEGIPIVFWSNLPNCREGQGGGGMSEGSSYSGRHSASDGRSVEFSAKTIDGETGVVTIQGTEYSTEKGTLFLISRSVTRTAVLQIPYDMEEIRKHELNLMEYAKTNPHVQSFFRAESLPAPAEPKSDEHIIF